MPRFSALSILEPAFLPAIKKSVFLEIVDVTFAPFDNKMSFASSLDIELILPVIAICKPEKSATSDLIFGSGLFIFK